MKRIVLILLGLTFALGTMAQPPLERYIEQGLKNNEALKQKKLKQEKSLRALQEAKRLYGPTVTFNTGYFRAAGGRTVDIPVGDMLNPVYQTLNEFTGSNQFPQLENQSILLNPDNFYDAKLHLTVPIYRADLGYNKRIKTQQVEMASMEETIYRRELVKEIKLAWYGYARATEAIQIYQNAQELVTESHRVNESLFKNDKVNRTVVLRSQNELTRIQAEISRAEDQQKSAAAWLNFLLNRELAATIELTPLTDLPPPLPLLTDAPKREELSQLAVAREIQEEVTGLSRSYLVPQLGGFVDVGSQGFDWQFNEDTQYYFAGVSLDWTLFGSGRNRSKIEQNELESAILASQTAYTRSQLSLQATTAGYDLHTATTHYQAAKSRLKAAATYYDDMFKLYKLGKSLYIELLDAQQQYTQSQLETNIALFNTWEKYTLWERATATYPLN